MKSETRGTLCTISFHLNIPLIIIVVAIHKLSTFHVDKTETIYHFISRSKCPLFCQEFKNKSNKKSFNT